MYVTNVLELLFLSSFYLVYPFILNNKQFFEKIFFYNDVTNIYKFNEYLPSVQLVFAFGSLCQNLNARD